MVNTRKELTSSAGNTRKELTSIANDLKRYIEAERAAGTADILSPARPRAAASDQKKARLLEPVKKEVLSCRRCALYKTKKNYVFSDGDPGAPLVFIGEAPGEDEDIQGVPFVGRAGQLLTKMIEAMGLRRQDVYICNVIKCRPPNNRAPLPGEAAACRDYLLSQIGIISPKVICCLGKHAAEALLGTEVFITKIRGKEFEFNGITLIPTYHPAYLLRNPSAKKEVWQDLKKIIKILSG
ncbi:MAG: uracil-DNA glycosylase [Candidatus Omnitrophica bacterium]|nr:uracil-DNA glycosylase [Candidatus Omnitrophota bacterium]